MKNDQWFGPGDKVMRVSHNTPDDPEGRFSPTLNLGAMPYGKVFCVESCYLLFGVPHMTLVGVALSPGSMGIYTNNFRKVEEIQLCAKAAQAANKPKKQEAQA